jgi:hypothetical protein
MARGGCSFGWGFRRRGYQIGLRPGSHLTSSKTYQWNVRETGYRHGNSRTTVVSTVEYTMGWARQSLLGAYLVQYIAEKCAPPAWPRRSWNAEPASARSGRK